ncbi:beta-glucan synthesis-associated [Thamnocephalis sphaerospora]|uniref:Beta-glucan synthesis-associated n=1 Tax=Thamnocephalis sphaerospora TaxID=78915 RepID=A0A4P9XRQ1_9FUNG|nr:beta-glucan synthesis-associated [Thamnocephalis sphaerospora]|eukprot:RKP08191.1 beta-glucan synthesis-associated [Thamnocephalis sphaerospora]
MSEEARAMRMRNMQSNQPYGDDVSGPLMGGTPRRRRLCGMPRWAIVTLGIILGIGVAFLAIGFPILKSTTWKNGADAEDGSDGVGGGGSGGNSSNKPVSKWIDPDTPKEFKTKKMEDGVEYKLVFSDEFNQDGRNFAPGKDKIWEAVDLHYWQTGDYERYTPEQATTKNGTLRITVEQKDTKGQRYASAMLQTWNNFCFRGGYIEASVSLPGSPRVSALWPAIWTMGNLGRAGYGASTEGLWPYSYDTCDNGVTPSQGNAALSGLPGQRLNKCLCSDQDTPTPGIGRSAAEIDLLEGAGGDRGNEGDEGNGGGGTVSQSHQFAPFDALYTVQEQFVVIHNRSSTYKNSYKGGKLQQAISVKTKIGDQYYEGKDYLKYAFAYEPGPEGKVVWWVDNDKKWTLDARAVAANPRSNVGQRIISEEPMYLLMNVAISDGFGMVDFRNARFPATMYVDYMRIYQHPDKIDIGCDPKDRPTKKYIDDHPFLYQNATLRKFAEAGYPLPQYSLNGQCKAQ